MTLQLKATTKQIRWVIGTKRNGPGASRPFDSIERMFESGEVIAMREVVRACGLVYFTADGYRFADNIEHYVFEGGA